MVPQCRLSLQESKLIDHVIATQAVEAMVVVELIEAEVAIVTAINVVSQVIYQGIAGKCRKN